MKKLIFLSALIFALFVGCSKDKDDLNNKSLCTPPANVTKIAESETSLSYEWDDIGQAVEYKLSYFRVEDEYTSPDYFTSLNSYTFTELKGGHYELYFYTICDGGTSTAIVIEDMIIR